MTMTEFAAMKGLSVNKMIGLTKNEALNPPKPCVSGGNGRIGIKVYYDQKELMEWWKRVMP